MSLKRVLSNISLTFEQFKTILVQIEGILNSRPLFPFWNDPNDLTPLTPAHFLAGKPIANVPDSTLNHIPHNRLDTYQYL